MIYYCVVIREVLMVGSPCTTFGPDGVAVDAAAERSPAIDAPLLTAVAIVISCANI